VPGQLHFSTLGFCSATSPRHQMPLSPPSEPENVGRYRLRCEACGMFRCNESFHQIFPFVVIIVALDGMMIG
jgi:hypothetical protein